MYIVVSVWCEPFLSKTVNFSGFTHSHTIHGSFSVHKTYENPIKLPLFELGSVVPVKCVRMPIPVDDRAVLQHGQVRTVDTYRHTHQRYKQSQQHLDPGSIRVFLTLLQSSPPQKTNKQNKIKQQQQHYQYPLPSYRKEKKKKSLSISLL